MHTSRGKLQRHAHVDVFLFFSSSAGRHIITRSVRVHLRLQLLLLLERPQQPQETNYSIPSSFMRSINVEENSVATKGGNLGLSISLSLCGVSIVGQTGALACGGVLALW